MSEIKEKTINPNVRAYMFKMAPKQLNSNPLFVKIYGSNFAHKRLKKHVLSVYTNEVDGRKLVSGYQDGRDKSIVLCMAGKDGGLLTPTEIENDPNAKETFLHECVHAMFRKSKEECATLNIDNGTGILITYREPGTGCQHELGRGLNEGYTEWMCEMAGLHATSYKTLTNFVRLLEAARGTEQVMSMGTGNLCQILDMEQKDVNSLLAISDYVYVTEDKLLLYKTMLIALGRANPNITDKEKSERAELYSALESEIEKLRNDVAFIYWAKEHNMDYSDASIMEYLNNESIPSLIESRDISAARFEDIVLNRYFVKDLNHIFEERPINPSNIDQIEKLISLLSNKDFQGLTKDICKNMTSVVIIEKFKELKKNFIIQIAKEDAKKYNECSVPLRDMIRWAKKYIGDNYIYQKEYFDAFYENVNDSHADATNQIMEAAWNLDEDSTFFEKIEDANIYSLKSANELGECLITSVVYSKNMIIEKYRSNQVVDKNSSGDFKFDYTMGDGEDIHKVVKQFEELKAKVLEEHPYASIHVAQRSIAIDIGDENPTFYYILDDNIVPMHIEGKEHIRFSAGDKKQENAKSMVPVNIKAGKIANFVNSIRRKIHYIKTRKEDRLNIVCSGETLGKINLYPGCNGITSIKIPSQEITKEEHGVANNKRMTRFEKDNDNMDR